MDALSDVLRTVRLTGAVFHDAHFSAPWSLLSDANPKVCANSRFEATRLIHYHLVTQGTCFAQVDQSQPIELRAGDLIVFPHGDTHVLTSTLGLDPVPTSRLPSSMEPGAPPTLTYGGGGDQTRMVCGFLSCDPELSKPLLAALPRMLHIGSRDALASTWIETSLRFLLDGSFSARPGSTTIAAKLAELLFVEAIRSYLDTLPVSETGWLAGLRDPFVGRALALMHAAPTTPWTVEDLGRRVGISRSGLAQRFADVLGQPPMHYLTKWRLHLAARLLRSTNRSIAAIIDEVGYESEPAFNRAFKRSFGVPPAAFRRGAAGSKSGELAAAA
jgi:AraC-like DNA-binding protein